MKEYNADGISNTLHLKDPDGDPVKVTINAPDAEGYMAMRDQADAIAKASKLTDRISEQDRLWFEKHPDREFRLRRAVQGELGPGQARWVLVAKVPELGGRMRCGVPRDYDGNCAWAARNPGRIPRGEYLALLIACGARKLLAVVDPEAHARLEAEGL